MVRSRSESKSPLSTRFNLDINISFLTRNYSFLMSRELQRLLTTEQKDMITSKAWTVSQLLHEYNQQIHFQYHVLLMTDRGGQLCASSFASLIDMCVGMCKQFYWPQLYITFSIRMGSCFPGTCSFTSFLRNTTSCTTSPNDNAKHCRSETVVLRVLEHVN